MRKLKLQVQMTVDGFIGGANGEADWMERNWDDKIKQYVSDLTEPVDTIILGRKLAQGFIPAWTSRLSDPNTADDFARKMVMTRKVIFTKTLDKSEWDNTVLTKGDLVAEITNLKKQDGKDIIAYGGATFISALIKHGLIDDFHLFINPTAIANGMTIFKGLDNRLSLTLVNSISFDCGIVVLHYEQKRG